MTLLEIGQVIRPHGLQGEVVVTLVTNRLERIAPGARLELRRPSGAGGDQLSALEVEAARPHQGRYLVRFVGVSSHEAAERLRNVFLLAAPESAPDELFVHDLIGKEVLDQDGIRRGVVTAVEANPASDLLVLDNRDLVPCRFIVEVGPATIRVEVPDGLFDL